MEPCVFSASGPSITPTQPPPRGGGVSRGCGVDRTSRVEPFLPLPEGGRVGVLPDLNLSTYPSFPRPQNPAYPTLTSPTPAGPRRTVRGEQMGSTGSPRLRRGSLTTSRMTARTMAATVSHGAGPEHPIRKGGCSMRAPKVPSLCGETLSRFTTKLMRHVSPHAADPSSTALQSARRFGTSCLANAVSFGHIEHT